MSAIGWGWRSWSSPAIPRACAKRCPVSPKHRCATLLAGDVRELRPLPAPPTHVVHMAAEASAKLNAERPLEMASTILDGTRRVLEVASAAGATRALFVSSGAVYGRQGEGLARVGEDHLGGPDPLHAEAAYGEAKRLAEQMCSAVARAHGIAIPIARCWAFLGPGLPLDAHFAAGNLIRDSLAGGPLTILGDGTAVRSYLYAADLAAWLVRLLVRGTSARAYNVGSDQAVSIRALAETVAEHRQPRPMIEIRGARDAQRPIDRYVPSTARARQELGLAAWTPLADAVGKTIAWHAPAGIVAPRSSREGR